MHIHTSKSFLVCGSNPLPPSTNITALSAAAKVLKEQGDGSIADKFPCGSEYQPRMCVQMEDKILVVYLYVSSPKSWKKNGLAYQLYRVVHRFAAPGPHTCMYERSNMHAGTHLVTGCVEKRKLVTFGLKHHGCGCDGYTYLEQANKRSHQQVLGMNRPYTHKSALVHCTEEDVGIKSDAFSTYTTCTELGPQLVDHHSLTHRLSLTHSLTHPFASQAPSSRT